MKLLWVVSLILSSNIPTEENVMTIEKARESWCFFDNRRYLLWSFQGIDDVECVGSFFDVDGDSVSDVLAESFDAGASGRSRDTIWAVWPVGGTSNSGGWGDHCVGVADDLNGDGVGDALLGTAWGGRTVFAISGRDGTTIWSYDTYQNSIASGWVYCVAAIDDIDGDSIQEILAGTGTNCQTVFCFSGATGAILWRFYAQDAIGSVCAVPDVNGDGFADVVAGAWGE
ncbi:MAG: hypothetical protein ACUVUD_02130 [bacterium]